MENFELVCTVDGEKFDCQVNVISEGIKVIVDSNSDLCPTFVDHLILNHGLFF